jgi:8-amino-7-oxononanoate synthase
MKFVADSALQQALQKRTELSALRGLRINDLPIDFCSNDYLGYARSLSLQKAIETEWNALPERFSGSTGSRLLAGNTNYVEDLERWLSSLHQAEAGLIYNSGYDANVGLFSALGQPEVVFLYDELIHASVHDGIKLSKATAYLFKHNDLQHLEERLKMVKGTVYVAVESIYSMDGDSAPLQEMVKLCEKYHAQLIVDEAHATGITGNGGKGLVQDLGLQESVFARLHTFGKALGCHGAIIVGSELLRTYLINFSRAFTYTTALPLHSLVTIRQSYQLLLSDQESVKKLNANIGLFKKGLSEISAIHLISSNSPIQSIIISGNEAVKKGAQQLRMKGLDVRPILSPTVPKGKERMRICIHSFNTTEELELLTSSIREIMHR